MMAENRKYYPLSSVQREIIVVISHNQNLIAGFCQKIGKNCHVS